MQNYKEYSLQEFKRIDEEAETQKDHHTYIIPVIDMRAYQWCDLSKVECNDDNVVTFLQINELEREPELCRIRSVTPVNNVVFEYWFDPAKEII